VETEGIIVRDAVELIAISSFYFGRLVLLVQLVLFVSPFSSFLVVSVIACTPHDNLTLERSSEGVPVF
jgi:hypothetical protein